MSTTKIISEKREVEKFSKIKMKGIGDITIIQGKTPSLKVSANQNVLPKLRTDIRNDELIISMKKIIPIWLTISPTIEIEITTDKLSSINVSGVGQIRSKGKIVADKLLLENSGIGHIDLDVKAKSIDSKISGSGHIQLKGEAVEQAVTITGTGKLDAYELKTEKADVKSRGIGECKVCVTKNLLVNMSGIGKVKYKGKPEVASKVTGLGSLESLD